MNVTELESKGLKRKIRITLDPEAIESQVETELKSAGQRVKLPGFRPGNVPMKILKQRYGKGVQADVIRQSINRATTDALKQKNLKPATTPDLKVEDYKDGGELAFTLDFEIFPDAPEIKFDKIKLDRPTFEVEEKDVDEALAKLAEHSPKLNPAAEGAKAKDGNALVIDFAGSIGGELFEGGSASDFRLELGSGQFIAGFEDQLVGARKGEERTVNVTFPKDYGAENLAGKEASFSVTVKDILVKEIPAVDEEFAKARGFDSLAGLRDAVRGQITREYEGQVRTRLKKQLFDYLESEYEFELPQGMVDFEFNNIWDRVKDAPDANEEEYRSIARRRVKLGLMLADIGSRNNLQITSEEMSRALMQQAAMFPGQEKKVMEFYRSHPEHANELRGPVLEEKAVDFILAKASFMDKKMTLKELAEDEDEGETAAKKPAKAKAAKTKSKKKS